ncbi:hypothetical protein LguiA_020817 [Lonicera macranthoides]
MEPAMVQPTKRCHVLAVPYPGRGHINPLLNLCRLIASRRTDILITFVVTEEWLGFIGSEFKPSTVSFCAIPNVIPSELVRAGDFPGFVEAVMTKMEAPVERLLARLEPPASLMISDTFLTWAMELGNRKNIPVASFWPLSATVFSIYYHFDLLVQNGHHPTNLTEGGNEEIINYIPGVPPMRIADLPTPILDKNPQVMRRGLSAAQFVLKAQYLLISSVYELEAPIIDALKENFPIPVYSIGPCIPYFQLENINESPEYIKWLDAQPKGSVLYISQGSFLSVSTSQSEEIVAGVRESGVRYFWVARTNDCRFSGGNDPKGLLVPWCDQLKVLSHSSIGGFWTHCGWNSTKEGVYAGVPMLTFPIMLDQVPNSKQIVRDWKVGWSVKREEVASETIVTREEVSMLVKRFMNFDNEEGIKMRKRSKEVMRICRQATVDGGSSGINVDAFVEDISQ